MCRCKFCGRPVEGERPWHGMCWEVFARELAGTFCDEYCRFPRECESDEQLENEHCDRCAMVQLLRLGG